MSFVKKGYAPPDHWGARLNGWLRRRSAHDSAFGPWHELVEGVPRLAHERFYWSRESAKLGVGLGV